MKPSKDVSSRGDSEISQEDVRAQLDRVLASEFFRPSTRHQVLLRTIVNESLAGRTAALKEIVLAKDVFGRPDYDPKYDTLVRVEVNAIRRKLAEYYARRSSADQVHINIPRGHYVAVFSSLPVKPTEQATHQEPATPHARWWRTVGYAFGAGAIALLVVVALLITRRSRPAPPGVPVQVTFDTGWTSLPAVSRDGSLLVYSSDRGIRGNADIWIQRVGKTPQQLTDDPAHDITPDISPDGTRVVFRSWRKEEGIWSISTAGGAAKLLAKGGYTPRFSPDGKWIAFAATGSDEISHIFAVPANGGLPKQLDHGVEEASCPVWSPNGSAVLFEARSANGGEHDLWTARATATRHERARPLGMQKQLSAQNLPVISSNIDCPQDWIEDRLLFVTHQRDTSFLLQVPLGTSGRLLGRIQAVPSAIGAEGARGVRGPHGQWSILFATERRQTNIWGYKLAGSAQLEQLTHDDSLSPGYDGTWPALSGDGNVLAFITERAGSPDICLEDLGTGGEQLLAARPSPHSPLFLDHNGSRILFVRGQKSTASVFLRNIPEKADHVITNDCPILQDWSQDGEFLLCADGDDLFQLRISRSGRTPLLHLTRPPVLARFSPDTRWIAFVTETGQGETAGFLAPLDGSNRRIEICHEGYGLSLHWARSGDAVYYWSARDGFRCLYKQPLQQRTKLPHDGPIPVLHRHRLQHYPWSGGTLAVSSTRLAMTLKDELANIWKADLPALTR